MGKEKGQLTIGVGFEMAGGTASPNFPRSGGSQKNVQAVLCFADWLTNAGYCRILQDKDGVMAGVVGGGNNSR